MALVLFDFFTSVLTTAPVDAEPATVSALIDFKAVELETVSLRHLRSHCTESSDSDST